MIPIVGKLCQTDAASLLAKDDVLNWLIQNTYSFDFAAWSVDLLLDLLRATAAICALPPSSLGIIHENAIP